MGIGFFFRENISFKIMFIFLVKRLFNLFCVLMVFKCKVSVDKIRLKFMVVYL